ncbi:YkvA family protein [Blastococcus sp. SYSU DS0619]
MDWLRGLLAVAGGLLLLWLVMLALLWRARPDGLTVRDALRLLPDLLRLVRRLAADRSLPRAVRARLWLLLAYLLFPVDLVPDVIPVLGYADDVVVTAWALRSVVRRAGDDALVRHWPGEAAGLAVVRRLAGLTTPSPPS